jgi:hypothetical protein
MGGTMRLVLSIAAAATAAGCLDPLVSDEPGVSVHVLPPGSPVPHVSDSPDLARQIRVGDGISDSIATMSGGLIPQKSGWAKGVAVKYWDLGDAPQVGALLYVLVARSGDQVVPLGHPYVGLALPGQARYSPFLFVQHVVVTDRYGGQVLPSAEAIADAVELGLVEEPVPVMQVVNGPIVEHGLRLDNGAAPPTETVPVYVGGHAADLLPVGGGAAFRPLARLGRLPRTDVHRIWVGNAVSAIGEPTFQNDASAWTPMARVIECQVTPPAEGAPVAPDEALLFTRDMMGNLTAATDRVLDWEITTTTKNWPLVGGAP